MAHNLQPLEGHVAHVRDAELIIGIRTGAAIDENLVFDASTFNILKNLCEGDRLLYETTRNLLDVERQYRLKGARHGLFDSIEKTIRSGFFVDEEDALEWHKHMKQISDDPIPEKEHVTAQLDFRDLEIKDATP